MLLLFALIVGSVNGWADTTIYSWNGNGSTTTANETGGEATAVQASGSNIEVGVSQKGNYCLKMNKGFSSGANYINIELDTPLTTGDKVTIGAFRTSNTSAVLGVDFGTTATQSLKNNTDVIESNGTPSDWEITVPAGANNSTTIRLYRNSGSTGMWVSKVVVTTASSDTRDVATWSLDPISATVTAGSSTTLQLTTNYDEDLTFTSNNPSIATVSYNSSTKVITVEGVAAGTTTISATGTDSENYKDISKSISVTVNYPEQAYNFTDVMSGFGYSYFGLTPTGSNTYVQPTSSTTKTDNYGVTIMFEKNEGAYDPRFDANYVRFYNGNKLTVTAPTGSYITKVVFTEPGSGSEWKGSISANSGVYFDFEKTWYAASSNITSVELSGTTGTNRIGGLKVYLNVSDQSVEITAVGWATYCSKFPLDFTSVTELTAYTASKDEDVVKFNKVTGKVPAETGLLISGTTTNVPVAASADAVSNILVGVTSNTVKEANSIFVLKNGDKGLGFYKNTNAFTVRANSAYLPADAVAGSRVFIGFNDDETTGINAVENVEPATENAVIYNLNGQRVMNPTKGLYIVNGKKVMINK